MLKLIKCHQITSDKSSLLGECVLSYLDQDLDSKMEEELKNNLVLFQVQMMTEEAKFEIKAPYIEIHFPLSTYQEDPNLELDIERICAEWDWEFKQFYTNLQKEIKERS